MTKDMLNSASRRSPEAVPTRQGGEDEVQEASEESFPASDSPSWTAGHEDEPASSSPANSNSPAPIRMPAKKVAPSPLSWKSGVNWTSCVSVPRRKNRSLIPSLTTSRKLVEKADREPAEARLGAALSAAEIRRAEV